MKTILSLKSTIFWSLIFQFICFDVLAQALPSFPRRNIDTRSIQKINGKFQTPTPHLPIMKMSLDGRIGLQLHRKDEYKLFLVKPERVQNHFKSSANNPVGGNMITSPERHITGYFDLLKNKFGSTLNYYDPSYEAFFCEKTDIRPFPFVCNTGQHDCYRLSLVTSVITKHPDPSQRKSRFASIDYMVMVKNPKTTNAFVEHVFPINNTEKLGPELNFWFSAEHNIIGDQRLMVFRTGGKSARSLNPSSTGAYRNNIVYSTYPAWNNSRKTAQCDVTQWRHFYPITHAHYDNANNMRNRYKFARYPFRDSLGRTLNGSNDLGGSYPWMDEEAANLFFTASGPDRFYNDVDGSIQGLFDEPPSNYVSPANVSNSQLAATGLDRFSAFEKADRTTQVSMAGFWTHGKTVAFDGQLNNTDYNFEVSTPGIGDLTRKLRLYGRENPAGQYYEPTGMTRDQGVHAVYSDYAPNMIFNSTFMNSMTHRFNFFNKMKTGVPKDVTWHFSSARHGEELAFDDYISPYVLINAEMTPAIGFNTNNADISMITFDGFQNGRPVTDANSWNFPYSPVRHSLAFQNAATAPDTFIKVPRFGRGIGQVRVEPIAKGGVHGKGLWLDGRAGLEFLIPAQLNSGAQRFEIENNRDYYLSVFIDPRWNGALNTRTRRTLITLNNNRKIVLVKDNTDHNLSNVAFDRIEFMEGSTIIGRAWLSQATFIFNSDQSQGGWKHIAFQFTRDGLPNLIVNGFNRGQVWPTNSSHTLKVKNFLDIRPTRRITLGSTITNSTNALRGWVDDFKLIARNITNPEERCNMARGTIVKINNQTHSFWRWVANSYGMSNHRVISSRLGHHQDTKYVCYVNYGNDSMQNLTGVEKYASLHNLPNQTQSVRDRLINENKVFRHNHPRPGQTTNNFCLSCHVPTAQNAFPEQNIQALQWRSGTQMQHDPRRQPTQTSNKIHGIIPANYFGPGKPANTINNTHSHFIDVWTSP